MKGQQIEIARDEAPTGIPHTRAALNFGRGTFHIVDSLRRKELNDGNVAHIASPAHLSTLVELVNVAYSGLSATTGRFNMPALGGVFLFDIDLWRILIHHPGGGVSALYLNGDETPSNRIARVAADPLQDDEIKIAWWVPRAAIMSGRGCGHRVAIVDEIGPGEGPALVAAFRSGKGRRGASVILENGYAAVLTIDWEALPAMKVPDDAHADLYLIVERLK